MHIDWTGSKQSMLSTLGARNYAKDPDEVALVLADIESLDKDGKLPVAGEIK